MRRNRAQVGMPILVLVLGVVLVLLVPQFFPDVANIGLVGWAVVVAGIVWLAIELVNANRTRSIGSETTEQVDPNTGARRTETIQDIE